MTATNPLSYLGEQLEAWRQAGTYQRLRVTFRARSWHCHPSLVLQGEGPFSLLVGIRGAHAPRDTGRVSRPASGAKYWVLRSDELRRGSE